MSKKCKFLISILIFATISFALPIKAMETEEEETEQSSKEARLEHQGTKPTPLQPKSLIQQAATKFINVFLSTFNASEREKFNTEYKDVFPEAIISSYLEKQSKQEEALIAQYRNLPEEVKGIIAIYVNFVNRMGETLLHEAKTPEDVEKLLFLGAENRIASKLEQDPFMATLARGNVDAARKILDSLKKIDGYKGPFITPDMMGFTNLDYALLANAVDLVTTILENPENAYAFPDMLNELRGLFPGTTSLLLATMYSPGSIKPILEKEADVGLKTLSGANAFLVASRLQSENTLKILAEHNQEIIRENDLDGMNALFYAAIGNNTAVIRYLIEDLKLDPNHLNNNNRTPLTEPLLLLNQVPEYQNIIFELLNYGANPNTSSTNLNIALLYNYNHTEFLKQYIESGANVNYVYNMNYQIETRMSPYIFYPLASAIFSLIPTMVPGIIQYGPIREELNYEIITFLVEKGAKIIQQHKDFILNTSNDELLINLIQTAPVFTEEELQQVHH